MLQSLVHEDLGLHALRNLCSPHISDGRAPLHNMANSIEFESNDQELGVVISNKNNDNADYFEISILFNLETTKGAAQLWYADMSDENPEPSMLLGSEMKYGVTNGDTDRDEILDRKPGLKKKTREFIQSAIWYIRAYGHSGGEDQPNLPPYMSRLISKCQDLMRHFPLNERPMEHINEGLTGSDDPLERENAMDLGSSFKWWGQ